MRKSVIVALFILAIGGTAAAGDIVDDWASVKPPPPPELRAVKLDPASTALLLLDFNGAEVADSGPCNAATKPRCLASLPKVRELLDKARARGVFVAYSVTTNATADAIRHDVAPAQGEPVVKSGPNKFFHTDLGDLLAQKQIKTVIVTGTASEGAVLVTATEAAIRGYTIVAPVDGMSSTDLYAEQYVAWHLTHAPGIGPKTALTRVDEIDF